MIIAFITEDSAGPVLFAIIVLFIYFIPWLNALSRDHLSSGAIAVVNLFFGWTLIGWLIALIWSCTGNTKNNRALTAREYAALKKKGIL